VKDMQNRYERWLRWGIGFAFLFFAACDTGGGGGCGEGGCNDLGCVAYRDGCGTGIKLVQGDAGGCGIGSCVAGCIDLESCVNDCDTCQNCELLPNTENLPEYQYPSEGPRIQQAVQLHVTNNLFTFVNERLVDVVASVAGDSLGSEFSISDDGTISICVPREEIDAGIGTVTICGGRTCGGAEGCQVSARFDPDVGIEIVPTPPNELVVNVTIDTIVLGSEGQGLSLNGFGCDSVQGGISPSDPPLTVSLPIVMSQNATTANTELEVIGERLELDTDSIVNSINIEGNFFCDIGAGLVEGQIGGIVDGVKESIEGVTCRGCEDNSDCAPNATCQDGVCNGDSYAVCQPIELGAQAGTDLTSLLSGFLPGLSAQLGITAFLSDHVLAEAQGLELGVEFGAASVEFGSVQGGFLQSSVRRDACVPASPPPTSGSDCANGAECPLISEIVDTQSTPVVSGEDQDGNSVSFGGEPFHIGAGISLSTINTALWAAYQSGLLCLTIDNSTLAGLGDLGSGLLGTGTVGSFFDGLTRPLPQGESAPLSISIRPSSPPYLELEESIIESQAVDPDSEDSEYNTFPATPLHVKIDDAALDFYMEVEGRNVRLFTAIVSLDLPLQVGVDGSAVVISLPSDSDALAQAIEYKDVTNVDYVEAEAVAGFFASLGDLIGGVAGGLLGEGIPPIDLGTLTEDLGALTITLPSPGLAAVANGNALGAFVRIDFDADAIPAIGEATQPLVPTIASSEVEYRDAAAVRDMISASAASGEAVDFLEMSPTVNVSLDTLGVGGDDVQYAYSVDGLPWSTWKGTSELSFRHTFLGLEGHHVVRFRARETNDWNTVSDEVAKLRVTTDYTAPTVDVSTDESDAIVEVSDNLSHPERMTMRYKVADSEWTPYTDLADSIDLSAWAGQDVELVVQVRDNAGNSQTVATDVSVPGTTDSQNKQSNGQSDGTPSEDLSVSGGSPRAGCTSAPGMGGAPIGGIAILLGLLFGLRGRGDKRHLMAALLVTAVAAFGMTGCSDDGPGVPSVCEECPEGQVCGENGECVDENLVCDPACGDDEVCEEGVCIPTNNCDPACGDGEECRDGTCIAVCDPACEAGFTCEEGECVEDEPSNRCFSNEDCEEENTSCYLGNDLPQDTRSCVPGVECPRPDDVCDCGENDTQEFTQATENQWGFCENPDEASCECIPPQPLPLGQVAKYNDAEVNPSDQTRRFTVAYNSSYGDLMLGEINEDNSIDWEFVDGVPTDEEPVGLVDGPRGGIDEPGEDAGKFASLAVSTGPVVHMSYHVETEEGAMELRYARGTETDGAWTFETFTVDSMDDAGYFTDIEVDEANGRVVISYSADGIVDDSSTPTVYFGEYRLAVANTLEVTAAEDFGDSFAVAQMESDFPCGERCGFSTSCSEVTNSCMPDAVGCGGCGEDTCVELGDGSVECQTTVAQSSFTRLPGSIGLFGDAAVDGSGNVHLAYYDRTNGNLRYSQVDVSSTPFSLVGTEPNIVDGERMQGGNMVDTGDVGLFPDLGILSDGSLRVAYYDATNGALWGTDPTGGNVVQLATGETVEEISVGDVGPLSIPVDHLVGADVDVLVNDDDTLTLVYQNASTGNLMQLNWNGVVGGGATTDVSILRGDAEGENYEGAFGFYTDQAVAAAGRFIVGTHFLFDATLNQGFFTYAFSPDGDGGSGE
jgi:hypothetical protein